MALDPAPSKPVACWQSADKYRTLFDSIDEGFCVIEVLFDPAGEPVDYVFVEVNPAFERHTGLSGAIGRRMRKLAPGHESHWFHIYGAVARTGEQVRFENPAEALGRYYDVNAFRVGEPGQNLVAVLFNDVSVRKTAERALREADQRKDEFIAILAHELRNPLAPMRNALQIQKIAPDDRAMVEQARQIMERQVDHMVALVDDLMDVSRMIHGHVTLDRQRIDLRRVVRHAIESAEPALRQRGHALALDLPDAEVFVDGDAQRLTQAAANLIVNAAKYTEPGGRLSVALRQAGDEACVEVADNGIGIAPDMLPRVFDLFTQASDSRRLAQGGLGIGLALVRQIMALHDGRVEAHSEGAGRGSRFTLGLPVAAALPVAAPDADAIEPSAAAPRRVLVADDNVDAAESLATMLRLLGHEVQIAFDGEQALAIAERQQPDLLLLDIGMPRVDGLTVARRVRATGWGRAARLIAITGWGQDADRLATRDAGFDEHLVKPVKASALREAVTRPAAVAP